MERVTGLEPVVSTLGKLHVTTTPNPHLVITSDKEDYSLLLLESQAFDRAVEALNQLGGLAELEQGEPFAGASTWLYRVSFCYWRNLLTYYNIDAHQFAEGEHTSMIKHVPLDKLVGTSVGTYYIEQFIGQSKLGPSFLAHADSTTTYLLRFLEGPEYATPKEREAYLEHFHYRAGQIAALKHPYILPLADFGVFRGLPYLVTPHIPLRSLRIRIDKNGALNTFTVGRYLDKIATALEYAHEHGVLHGDLSVDTIFIRLDGQLVVTDVGVRSLLEMNSQDKPRNQSLAWGEGCAPEQLLGKPPQPSSDVYALGAVIYHLLTGSSVFAGSTGDEIAQQHLYASVPSLPQRGDLPVGLYSILARAMAKEPAQRFHLPGAFANAYHSAIGQTNSTRLPFAESEAPSTQKLQALGTETSMADTQVADHVRSDDQSVGTEHTSGKVRAMSQSSLQSSTDEKLVGRNDSPRPALMRRFRKQQRERAILIAALVALLIIASSAVGITLLLQKSNPLLHASGQVTFFSNQPPANEQTNALHITFTQLVAPPAGKEYEAWILNDQTEDVLGLGKLIETKQSWSLTYSGTNNNLLAAGDKLEITQEQGNVNVPAGPVILIGNFPVRAFQHVEHLLVSFPPAPGKTALLLGLMQQTHLLDNQAVVLQTVASNRNTALIGCVTQSMLDIIEGVHGLHYHMLTDTCMDQGVIAYGDGYGLLGKGYVSTAEKHAALALSQPDATSIMHQHAALMDIALSNITGWVTTMEQDLLHLRSHPTDLSSLQEITTLADNAYRGVDVNGDGQIEPVAGEAGALIAFQQGQLMATLTLAPAA